MHSLPLMLFLHDLIRKIANEILLWNRMVCTQYMLKYPIEHFVLIEWFKLCSILLNWQVLLQPESTSLVHQIVKLIISWAYPNKGLWHNPFPSQIFALQCYSWHLLKSNTFYFTSLTILCQTQPTSLCLRRLFEYSCLKHPIWYLLEIGSETNPASQIWLTTETCLSLHKRKWR